MKYIRVYQPKLCAKCGETISAPSGPQKFCEPCATVCSVDGCGNKVRAGGLCTTHYRPKFAVTALKPIAGACGVAGCGRALKQKGMCAFHYGRAYHYGDVGGALPRVTSKTDVPCAVEGCDKLSRAHGYCPTHYQRFRTTGAAGPAELLRAEQGQGYITEAGYRQVSSELEHRAVMAKKLGRALRGKENVHHIDGNKLNNDPSNLELWTTAQPSGQRVEDRIAAAKSLLTEYGVTHEVLTASSVFDAMMSFGM